MKIIFDAFECGGHHIATDIFATIIIVGAVIVNAAAAAAATATVIVIIVIARADIVIIFDLNAFGFITTILKPNFHLCCR